MTTTTTITDGRAEALGRAHVAIRRAHEALAKSASCYTLGPVAQFLSVLAEAGDMPAEVAVPRHLRPHYCGPQREAFDRAATLFGYTAVWSVPREPAYGGVTCSLIRRA